MFPWVCYTRIYYKANFSLSRVTLTIYLQSWERFQTFGQFIVFPIPYIYIYAYGILEDRLIRKVFIYWRRSPLHTVLEALFLSFDDFVPENVNICYASKYNYSSCVFHSLKICWVYCSCKHFNHSLNLWCPQKGPKTTCPLFLREDGRTITPTVKKEIHQNPDNRSWAFLLF